MNKRLLAITILMVVLVSSFGWAQVASDDIKLKLIDSGTGSALSRFINYRRAQNMLADGTNAASQVLFKDGTAAAPSITFGSDPDTGIYRYGTNDLGLATNGSVKAIVKSGGNVLIGTTTDDGVNKLQVVGGIRNAIGSCQLVTKTFSLTNGASTPLETVIPTLTSSNGKLTFVSGTIGASIDVGINAGATAIMSDPFSKASITDTASKVCFIPDGDGTVTIKNNTGSTITCEVLWFGR